MKKLLKASVCFFCLFSAAQAQYGPGSPPTTSLPLTIAGQLNIAAYFVNQGGVLGAGQSSGQRATNCTALQAAINFGVTNKLVMLWNGYYEISCVAGIVVGSSGAPFTLRGTLSDTTLVQFYNTTTGAPVLTIGDSTGVNSLFNAIVDGVILQYGSTQTATQTLANALVVGPVSESDIRNINIAYGGATQLPYRGFYCPLGGGGFFSNKIANISITGAQFQFFNMACAGTGNHWDNIYMNNQINGTTTQLLDTAMLLDASAGSATISDQVFTRLNIEHVGTQDVIWTKATSATFIAPHFEDIVFGTVGGGSGTGPAGTGPVMVIGISSVLKFESMLMFNMDLNTANHAGTVQAFAGYGDGVMTIDTPWFTQSSPPTTQNETIQVTSAAGGTTPTYQDTNITINNAFFANWDSFPPNMDAILTAAVAGDIRSIDGYSAPSVFPHTQHALIANPATAFVVVGAVGADTTVVYDAPIAGTITLVLGVDMMGSGNGSSTLRPVGHQVKVVRTSAATGNFNIVVHNGTVGGATLGTFTGTGSVGTAQTFGFTGTAWTASP